VRVSTHKEVEDVMKKMLHFVAITLALTATAWAQSDRRPLPPRLEVAVPASTQDEFRISPSGRRYYLRTGSRISLPLTPEGVLQLSIPSPFSTAGMDGRSEYRLLPLQLEIVGALGFKYSPPGGNVATVFTGHKSGIKNRASLLIEPKRLQVVIRNVDYVKVAVKDGYPVYLKPGRWTYELSCSFVSMVDPDGHVIHAPKNSEAPITGKWVGRDRGSRTSGNYGSYIPYVEPVGPMINFAISQVGNLFGLLHRPNISIPAGTQLNFQITNLEATYTSEQPPTEPID
jgi:hypothetical protein